MTVRGFSKEETACLALRRKASRAKVKENRQWWLLWQAFFNKAFLKKGLYLFSGFNLFRCPRRGSPLGHFHLENDCTGFFRKKRLHDWRSDDRRHGPQLKRIASDGCYGRHSSKQTYIASRVSISSDVQRRIHRIGRRDTLFVRG